jgi:hypothetical protein
MAEMASMGVGSKAFWDIAPSEEAINDRNINYVLKRRGSRHPTEGGVRWRPDPLLLLACAPWLPQARWGSDLSLFLIQMFALGPPLLWPHLTVTTLIWVPWAPFLETVPLALFWALLIYTCTEIQLLWVVTGPCIHPTSQRKHH